MSDRINRLFVAYKPTGLSSNQFLGKLKRRYKLKKAGYSGTLDPFAKGVLIVAFGGHTRLFRFLSKTPKTYRATLWLGASSETLDIEGVKSIADVDTLHVSDIEKVLQSLKGTLTYKPPNFCAKKISGKRAYELARKGEDIELKDITSKIYDISLIHYSHPFITFEASVSEGTYIRSIGSIIASKLNIQNASLSALERIQEGIFSYNNEVALDIKKSLNIPQNFFLGDTDTLLYGRKIDIEDIKDKSDGQYWIDCGSTITIIEITDMKVTYLLNKVEAC